jgi:uroporphyrinogen decarboxylase
MNDRERTRAILHYEDYDRLPLVHFGFWDETPYKWAAEGHITQEEAGDWDIVAQKLGFDFEWSPGFGAHTGLFPSFEEKVLEELPDGSRKVLNADGAIVIQKDDATGIPSEVDHILKGREEWEEHYLPRLRFSAKRLVVDDEKLAYLRRGAWGSPLGVSVGSLYGKIRDYLGLVNSAYLQVDDPALFDEMIETVAELCYQCAKAALDTGIQFDYAHFWEDICFKSGPLINPRVFGEKVGPHYKRITDLLLSHGVDIVSLDCDGKIDALVPIWLENGVNTMFPIEVGTWGASIAPWRERYGRELRGVGGMDKRVFARDYAAVDAEVERLRPLIDLGGYIPCPDHRIPPDAKWENVQYYCDRMRQVFG